MAGDSVCFNATVTDDNFNERLEYSLFYLYLHNNFTTDKILDQVFITVRDNEDGQLIDNYGDAIANMM